MGLGAEEGSCTASRPPVAGFAGELKGAATCNMDLLGGGLSGREALSFLPFFSK